MAALSRGNVVYLSRVKAMRDTLEVLHSPETKALVYAGASWEFKQVVVPVLKQLLAAKGTPESVQTELLRLLERTYAEHQVEHVTSRD